MVSAVSEQVNLICYCVKAVSDRRVGVICRHDLPVSRRLEGQQREPLCGAAGHGGFRQEAALPLCRE